MTAWIFSIQYVLIIIFLHCNNNTKLALLDANITSTTPGSGAISFDKVTCTGMKPRLIDCTLGSTVSCDRSLITKSVYLSNNKATFP